MRVPRIYFTTSFMIKDLCKFPKLREVVNDSQLIYLKNSENKIFQKLDFLESYSFFNGLLSRTIQFVLRNKF